MPNPLKSKKKELIKKVRESVDTDAYVMQFSMDGLNHELFHSMVDSGYLPNIKSHIYDRAFVKVRDGLSVFPSVTPYAHEAFTTGRMSRHPGLRWFNKKKQKMVDYTSSNLLDAEGDMCLENITIHELLSPSTSIWEFANKGSTKKIMRRLLPTALRKWAQFMVSDPVRKVFNKEYLMKNWRSNLCRAADETVQERTVKEILYDPAKITTSWFLGVDEMGHCNGFDNGVVAESYRDLDSHVGKIADAYARKGIYDDTLFVLFSDHGNLPVENNSNLEDILEEGSVHIRDKIWKLKHDVICTYFGDATGYIYLSKKPWTKKSDREEIVDSLIADGSVDFVSEGDGDVTIVYTDKGNLLFHKKGDEYKMFGDNVLEYTPAAEAELRQWHTLDDHMRITHDEKRPFILPSLTYVFSDKRSPDFAVASKEGYDFSGETAHNAAGWIRKKLQHTNLKSADGLATKDCMSVPIMMAGDKKRFSIDQDYEKPYASLIDVVPTILDIMDVPDDLIDALKFDGKSIMKRKY